MATRVNDETARILLLQMIRDLLDLDIDQRPNPNPDALELRREQFEHFGKELGRTPAEVSRIYERLFRERFISTYNNEAPMKGEDGVIQIAWILDLTDKADQLLGVLSKPQTEFLETLDAVLAAIQTLDSREVSEEQKKFGEMAAGELKQFIRALTPQAAMQFAKAYLATRGVHLP